MHCNQTIAASVKTLSIAPISSPFVDSQNVDGEHLAVEHEGQMPFLIKTACAATAAAETSFEVRANICE